MRNLLFSCLVIVAWSPTWSAEDAREREAFFESKIRPVLVAKCYECHSAKAKDPKGGLLVDTREGIRRGGDSGHGVVPGELDDSLILSAIRYESMEMPPDEQLPEQVIADFETWVRDGAYDPREGKSAVIRREIDFDRAREFWSFRPIADPPMPRVTDSGWARNAIDAFVQAKLEAKRLQPNDDASPAKLARRIYFDLIGLPPTPEQVEAFVSAMRDNPDQAVASLVDSLLASSHFGERWGRHWLDVVRYAESTGMERNATFTRAWRYRDYVIDAFNRDLPYDQFVLEQIAGDLLPHASNEQRDRRLVATGVLAIGPKSLNETKREKFKMDVVDDQIDVVTRAFLGLTASCARCHDHKFDPIPQAEYYSLAGIFTSTKTLYGTSKTNGNRNPGQLLAIDGEQVASVNVSGGAVGSREEKRYRAQVKALERRIATLTKQGENAKQSARGQIRKRLSDARDDLRRAQVRLRRATQPQETAGKGATLVMAVTEADKIDGTKLRVRGEPDEYGKEVPRGFLTIASLEPNPEFSQDFSGRRELAQWITRPSNPLTARVMVNRVWQHLFGRGLVTTVNNFGANGDRPTHPLLLDHLATGFVDDGWSVKQLIRRIMLSRTYRLSTADTEHGLAIDPDNRLFWRMNQRRLEAEAIRDAMLLVSGQLDVQPQPSSPVETLGEGIIGRNLRPDRFAEDRLGRSVYLPIVRGNLPEMLSLFDFPEPSIIGGVRDVTTVPTQALYMMNSPFVLQAAEQLATRAGEATDKRRDRVRRAYQLALSRQPTASETERAIQFVDETAAWVRDHERTSESEAETKAWTGLCQSILASSEFRYLD